LVIAVWSHPIAIGSEKIRFFKKEANYPEIIIIQTQKKLMIRVKKLPVKLVSGTFRHILLSCQLFGKTFCVNWNFSQGSKPGFAVQTL